MKPVLVTVAQARGSTPRATGVWMAVFADHITGTIGGGQLEYMAIDAARTGRLGPMEIPLGPEIGQCCGGHVTLILTQTTAADVEDRLRKENGGFPQVQIHGAGHTGRALLVALTNLPVNAVLIDSRADELAKADRHLTRLSAIAEAEVATAAPGSAFVIMTHDHALDFLIAAAALQRGDAAYVGMIGSATKRARFASWCRSECPDVDPQKLICPIGAGAPADKRPEVIAAFTATELLTKLASTARTREDAR